MKRYVLDNARMILKYAGLEKAEMALALNRIYQHYSGDDIFEIAGIVYEDTYVKRPERVTISGNKKQNAQMTFDELKGGEE